MIFLAFKQALHLGDIVKNTRVRDTREETRLWGVGSRKGELENFRAGHLGLLSINFNFWNVIFLADGISLHLGEVQMKIYERSLQALLLLAPRGFTAHSCVLTRLDIFDCCIYGPLIVVSIIRLTLTFMSICHQYPRHKLFLTVISKLIPNYHLFFCETTLQVQWILPVELYWVNVKMTTSNLISV